MPWWQSAFASSKSHLDDSLLGGKNTLKSAIFSRRNNRQLTRAKKLRHLSDNEVELWRSPITFEQHHPSAARTKSANAAIRPSPQPLPLPELQLLLRRDAKSLSSTSCDVPLPSPRDMIAHQVERERARERPAEALNGAGDVSSANGTGSKLASQDARRSTEHSETRSARRSPQTMNGSEKLPDKNGFNGPVSAPASPYSSSHRGLGDTFPPQHVTPPACFQVWSAPEMPSSETTIPTEKTAYSVDSSPLQSPRISPSRSAKSPRGLTSPLPSKLPAESSLARREGASQANVHPLPLPPGAMPLQPAPVPHHAPIPEVMPVKSRWQKGKLIGRGTFGSVYVASNRETGALCAMKEVEILPDDTKSAESIKQLEQEIKVLSNLKHPNIVQYYGSEIVGDRFYIYLEYVHPGSITKFIKDHCGAITESVIRNFTRHILCGLAYLHSTKTIHRDIKGANLLVDAFGVVKLADFGMAKHLNGHRENLSLKGSPYWMAPELLQSVMHEDATSDIALAVDVWSLGCTIVEMLSGRPPWSEYEGAASMFKVLQENPPIPDNLSEEGRDFLNCCFKRNPAERPSASMLLEHRFVKGPHQQEVPSLSGMKLAETVHSQ